MRHILALAVLSLVLAGCGETPAPTELAEPVSPALLSGAPRITTGPFFAVAACQADIGFNILFGGERVLMTHTTTDKKGKTHTTEHFRVQDFKGWRILVPVPPQTPPDFDVQGGAEMFSTHRDPSGNIMVRIHQGNLVFRDRTTGERVIAHHTIRIVPGQDPVSFWSCRRVG